MHLHLESVKPMTRRRMIQLATFLLRTALGVMLIAHSLVLKLLIYTLPGTAQAFVAIGLPGWSAYAVFAIEAVAGVLLVLGVRARWAALAVIPVLIGATWALPATAGCSPMRMAAGSIPPT